MNDNFTILLVDNDLNTTQALSNFLQSCGHFVKVVGDGQGAMQEMRSSSIDLMIVETALPKMRGRDLLRLIRNSDDWTPIIFCTSASDAMERAIVLDEGADDYICKPLNLYETLARIRAVLRRVHPRGGVALPKACLKSGGLVLDPMTRRVWFRSKELALTPKSITLLEFLMSHPDQLMTRDQLLDAVWGWGYAVGTRAVDARIAELRRILERNDQGTKYIETVLGYGYRFTADVEILTHNRGATK